MTLRRAWIAAPWLLHLAAGTARAQEFEDSYIPEEAYACPRVTAEIPGPLDCFLVGLLLGLFLVPLIAAVSSALGRQFTAARRWIIATFVVAGAQAGYGVYRALSPREYDLVGSTFFDLARLTSFFNRQEEPELFLAAGATGAILALALRTWVGALERRGRPPLVGERVHASGAPRTPPTAAGAGSAPPG